MSELPDMGYEALERVRRIVPIIQRGDNVPGYEALERVAPFLSCWQFGHPDQPRARRTWQRRPWRCDRCGTWWVTEKVGAFATSWWEWTRVEVDQ